MLRKLSMLGLLLLVSNAAAGAEPLFTIEKIIEKQAGPLDDLPLGVVGASEQHWISVDPLVVAANPRVLTFELPDGRRLEARRGRFHVYDSTWKSWFGELRYSDDGSSAGYAHLIYHGEFLTGVLNLDDSQYQIAVGEGRHRLVRLSEPGKRAASCGVPEPGLQLNPDPRLESSFWSPSPASTFTEQEAGVPTKATRVIDVLALYPSAITGYSDTQRVRLFILDSISIANDVFVQSNSNAQYRLVGIEKITGDQPPTSLFMALISWMNKQPTPTEITGPRTNHQADMVALFIDAIDKDKCGIANIPTGSSPALDKAFSVHSIGCGLNDYTFAHELGHNMGMRHMNDTDDMLFSWGRGARPMISGQTVNTVLSCPSDGLPCIPQFSNRNAVPPTGDKDHNNARVAREQADDIANLF